jgi:hypothetical protein
MLGVVELAEVGEKGYAVRVEVAEAVAEAGVTEVLVCV